jgi:hypothetical protein
LALQAGGGLARLTADAALAIWWARRSLDALAAGDAPSIYAALGNEKVTDALTAAARGRTNLCR